MNKIYRCAGLLLVALLLLTLPALAAGNITIAVNQSQVLTFSGVESVAVANPEIADVAVASSSEVLVIGKSPGITTLHIWSAAGRESYEVEVGANDNQIADIIKNMLGYSDVHVSKVNKTVLLEGTVNDQYQKLRAEKVAGAYGEKVVNLLEITNPKQVKIEAKILEISRDKLDELGVKWGNNPGAFPGIFSIGQSSINTRDTGDKFGWFGSYTNINAQINALVTNGFAKILSQPNIITISGEKANIFVGGEIPIPVALEDNRLTIEWKEYGIKLAIAPEVSTEGMITSRVQAEVSSIDSSTSNKIELGDNIVIPAIKTRKAETAITMASGQTMAIGGLITSEDSKTVSKIPLLGDLPILGKLFRSTSFSSGKTEVVIIITPSLVQADEYQAPATDKMQEFMTEDPYKDAAKQKADVSDKK